MIFVNHRACFEESLDDHPEDWDLRLAYADFLDDIGDDWGAVTQRYMATLKRCPDTNYFSGFWTKTGGSYPNDRLAELFTLLPIVLSVDDIEHRTRTYKDRISAESALCQALRLYSAAMDTADGSVCVVPREIMECPGGCKSQLEFDPKTGKVQCSEQKAGWYQANDVLSWAQTPDPQSKTWEFLDTIRRTK